MGLGKKRLAVVGLGYVGLPLAILARQKGYDVFGIDSDPSKVSSINASKLPFVDATIGNRLKKYPISASTDPSLLSNADIIIICVPTPVNKNYFPDLGAVKSATNQVGKALRKGQLVIVESTINPGVCDDIIIPILEKKSGLVCGSDFYIAHCPERVSPGDPNWGVQNIARVVGGFNSISTNLAYDLYSKLINAPIKKMDSLKEAEAVKVVENSFRDVNIAFVNELAMSFSKMGIDVVNVIDGAATKPFSFMAHYPGVGVGGHCIPVDPYYLIEYAKKNGFSHKFLKMARKINKDMPAFTVEQLEIVLRAAGRKLKNTRVAVLGLSYKPNVGDLRESPSLDLIELLKKRGAKVVALDPYIESVDGVKAIKAKSRAQIKLAIKGSTAVILSTAHEEYTKLKPKDFADIGVKFLVDGRNVYNKTAFKKSSLVYKGIGR